MDTLQKFEILVLGGPKVGKKTFLERILTDEYIGDEPYTQSLGVVSGIRESIVGGSKVSVNITVCSGRRRHLPIVQQFYGKINGSLILYDCSAVESFKDDMVFWYNEIKRSLPTTPIYLLSTKIDVPLNLRKISEKDGTKQAEEMSSKHFSISSKAGTNIERMWDSFLSDMVLVQEKALESENASVAKLAEENLDGSTE